MHNVKTPQEVYEVLKKNEEQGYLRGIRDVLSEIQDIMTDIGSFPDSLNKDIKYKLAVDILVKVNRFRELSVQRLDAMVDRPFIDIDHNHIQWQKNYQDAKELSREERSMK